MSDTPLVSVIVPAYNGERHIRQCVESVLAQTLADFELICVNDGSTDGTGSLLDDMAARDDRMRVIHQENKGEGAARNAGLDVARGRYLASLDADAFPADRVSSPGDNPDKLFYAFQNWTWNKLFRSSFVQASGLRFHEVQRSADLYFVCCALAQADRVATVDEVLYHYRVNNPNSNIATNERAPLDFYRSFVAVKQHLENVGRFAAVERGFKNWAAESVFFNLCSLKARDAFEELRREMQQCGCVELGLDTMKKAEFFDPRTYDQVRHLLCDDADDFLFFLLRETNRRMEEQKNDALRAWREVEELRASKTYRVGEAVLKPAKKILGR